MGYDAVGSPEQLGNASYEAAGKGPPRRPIRGVTDMNEWREKTRHMWELMPAHVQDRVIERLIESNPRILWMTIISLLDSEQDKHHQEQQDA